MLRLSTELEQHLELSRPELQLHRRSTGRDALEFSEVIFAMANREGGKGRRNTPRIHGAQAKFQRNVEVQQAQRVRGETKIRVQQAMSAAHKRTINVSEARG